MIIVFLQITHLTVWLSLADLSGHAQWTMHGDKMVTAYAGHVLRNSSLALLSESRLLVYTGLNNKKALRELILLLEPECPEMNSHIRKKLVTACTYSAFAWIIILRLCSASSNHDLLNKNILSITETVLYFRPLLLRMQRNDDNSICDPKFAVATFHGDYEWVIFWRFDIIFRHFGQILLCMHRNGDKIWWKFWHQNRCIDLDFLTRSDISAICLHFWSFGPDDMEIVSRVLSSAVIY